MTSWLYKKVGAYLKDAVYAANDGIITTFAVVAGVVGASLEPIVILVLGFANLFADGVSMAGGNYLGTKSESDLYKKQYAENKRLFEEDKEAYKKRIVGFLQKKGCAEKDVVNVAELIIHNDKFSLDFIMHEEVGLIEQEAARPVKGALVTLFSFMTAGLIPLLPYILLSQGENTFLYALLFTVVALFGIGAMRSVFIERSWLYAGTEMLMIGGLAASVAYGVGFIIKQVI